MPSGAVQTALGGGAVHRLGVVLAVVGGVWWAWGEVVARRRERRTRRRVEALLALERARRYRAWLDLPPWVRGWAGPVGVGLAGYVLVGGVAGCLVGAGAVWGVRRWRRRPRAGAAQAEAIRQLPLAADLLAACVAAGAGPREAAEAVGVSLGGPVGGALARAAAELRLGGEPESAWRGFGELPGAGELARCLIRAGTSGAPAAEPVARVARELRAERERAAEAGAQRAQVLITAPVGLCFLPAFLAMGVAPVVIGLMGVLMRN
ncbi:type II secretion system F family protein [Streptomyces sp. NPDC001941]|uniref:type II secretion system F family protein n=1 Tax=Streptomyces sp. NPDC001941 TaxID=3154659 RepID=UPI00331AD603